MLDRDPPNLRAREFPEAERILQLIEEHGNPVVDLRVRRRWNRPRGHFGAASPDDLIPMESNKVVEHKHARFARWYCLS
jgi:hypothetical protein